MSKAKPCPQQPPAAVVYLSWFNLLGMLCSTCTDSRLLRHLMAHTLILIDKLFWIRGPAAADDDDMCCLLSAVLMHSPHCCYMPSMLPLSDVLCLSGHHSAQGKGVSVGAVRQFNTCQCCVCGAVQVGGNAQHPTTPYHKKHRCAVLGASLGCTGCTAVQECANSSHAVRDGVLVTSGCSASSQLISQSVSQ